MSAQETQSDEVLLKQVLIEMQYVDLYKQGDDKWHLQEHKMTLGEYRDYLEMAYKYLSKKVGDKSVAEVI